MNEIQLSKDINILTAEINSYKQIAGQSIWEIGRRLNYVKENDLTHGEFITWVNSLGMDRTEAFRFMKVANELPNVDTWQHLGNRALYLVATLPEEERTQPHETAKGETKTPDEMTVRELQELKKQLKAKDKQIDNLSDVINDMSVQQPEVVEKEIVIEKVPDDYNFFKGNYEAAKTNYEFYKKQNEEIRQEMKALEERIKNESTNDSLKEELSELKKAKFEISQKEQSYERITALERNVESFIQSNSGVKYSKDFQILSLNQEALANLENCLDRLSSWVKEIKSELPNKKIIEGELLK